MSKTSIIVPVYNEEESIEKVLSELKKYLSQGCEIIAVNDGSTDGSKKILERVPEIKLVNHEKNLGYGAALKSGVRTARGEYILIIDADGSYPAGSVSELLRRQESYDMVVGARTNPQSQIPLARKPAKWLLNQMANYLTGAKIPDLNSGLRIIKKDVLKKFWHLLPDGFSFTTTLTLALLTNGYKIKYLPVDYYKRKGKSKMKPIHFLDFLQLIVKSALYFNPLKIFLPASLVILLAAIIIGGYTLFFAQRFADTTFIILCATALQTFFFGLLAELIIRTKKQNP